MVNRGSGTGLQWVHCAARESLLVTRSPVTERPGRTSRITRQGAARGSGAAKGVGSSENRADEVHGGCGRGGGFRDRGLCHRATVGGAVAGSLESLVASSPQTLHDAAFLPALAALHLTILTEEGESLGQPDILALFGRVARDTSSKRSHPVPAFVASRSPQAAHRLRAEMGWA